MKKLIQEIEHWNTALSKHDKELKYLKMTQSEYIFFRGTNHLFWHFACDKINLNSNSDETTKTWIQGDLHAYNYGTYKNDKSELIYDLNDFDESYIADYHYDLLRMSVSLILIGLENGFKQKQIFYFINDFVSSYLEVLNNYIKEDKIPKAITAKNAKGKLDEVMEQVEKSKSRRKQIKNWTISKENKTLFDLDHPKLVGVSSDLKLEIGSAFEKYAKEKYEGQNFPDNYFDLLDIAQRITSGTGSYGLPRYYLLIRGKENNSENHVILDMKLQTKPSAAYYLKEKSILLFKNEAERHQAAYKALGKNIDNHLGVLLLNEMPFSVRERSPYKSYFPTQILNSEVRFKKMTKQWGRIIASAHLRASKEFSALKVIHLDELNDLSQQISTYAFEYYNFNANAYKKFTNHLFLNE